MSRIYTHSPYEPVTHEMLEQQIHCRTLSYDSVASYGPSWAAESNNTTPHQQHRRVLSTCSMNSIDGTEWPQPVNPALRNDSQMDRRQRGHRRAATLPVNANTAAPANYCAQPPRVAHPALENQLQFISIPTERQLAKMPLPEPCTNMTTPYSVFFGQCRFETTPLQMMWLVLHLTQGTCVPAYLHPRGPGCFTAYFHTEQQASYVRGFHECLLCDNAGVWLARDESERNFLANYISSGRSVVPRLPRGAMIIRE